MAVRACCPSAIAAEETPIAKAAERTRRQPRVSVESRCSPAVVAARRARALRVFDEQADQLIGHRAAQLLGVEDGDGAAVIARDVVADADGGEFHRRLRLRSPRSPGADGAPDSCPNSPTAWNRPPARRRKSPSGCGAVRAAPPGGYAPTSAPRRRCSPSAGLRASSGRDSCARAATARRPPCR